MHISATAPPAVSTTSPASGKSKVVPPGLARRDLELPPGIARKLGAGGAVPPGISRRFPAAAPLLDAPIEAAPNPDTGDVTAALDILV